MYELAKRNCKRGELSTFDADFLEAYNTGSTFPTLFEKLENVSRSTLKRWAKQLKDSNSDYHVLAPAWGTHRTDKSKITEDESRVLFSQLLHPNRVKVGTAITVTKYILEGECILSPSSPATMRRVVEKFQNKYLHIWTASRDGQKALVDTVIPYIQRDDSQLNVGDVLVADGHRCNFFVKNPWTGKRCRPLLIGFYDWKSRILCGWAMALEENVQVISAALRSAILRLGKMPRIILLDNGKAFKSRFFVGENNKDLDLTQSGLTGLYSKLGIQTVFAWPYNPQSKPIEQFFGKFGNSFERYIPSFCGGEINDKPATLMRNEKQMQEFFGTHILEIKDAGQALLKWWDFHAWTDHPTIKGQKKGEVFEVGRGTGVDEAQLRYLMMAEEVRSIRREGIKMLGEWYWNEALFGFREPVIARYEHEDISKVHVYLKSTGQYLCTAQRVIKTNPMARLLGTPEDVTELSRQIKTNRGLKRDTMRVVGRLTRAGSNIEPIQNLNFPMLHESIPTLADGIESAVNEVEGARSFEDARDYSADDINEPREITAPEEDTDKVVPFFESEIQKYNYLSNKCELNADDIAWLEEEFYKTDSGRAMLEMDGNIIKSVAG